MAIINNIDQLKETARVNADSKYENWLIYLNDARDHFLVNYLGLSLVEKLEELDPASSADEDKKTIKVLLLARRVLGPYAVMLSTDEMSILTGSGGHTVAKSDKLAPASDAKIARAAASLLERAWKNLECLLEYLDENSTDFPEWKNSKYFKNRQTKYFASAEIFQDAGLIDIEYSRLTFEKLRQLIIRIEKSELKQLLYDDVEALIFNPGADEIEQAKAASLLEKIRAYIGAKVGELHTSEQTKRQRSQNAKLEYKAVIRPLYSDELDNDLNYYVKQSKFWANEIIKMLPDFGVDLSDSKLEWDNEGKKIFSAIT